MNLARPLRTVASLFYSVLLRSRFLLPPQRSRTFTSSFRTEARIGQVYVINLDRETVRWSDVMCELNHIVDDSGVKLTEQSTRFSAIDAREMPEGSIDNEYVHPFYTLADQLYVEPQPNALPDEFELDRPIRMSPPEIAVAQSHIRVCQLIAEGPHAYALVLEDDVYFERGFGSLLDTAWKEMSGADQKEPQFDILYLSYKEVKNGARKEFLSSNVFRPERGLWYFSGYVLSKKGARKLLELLPCRGPIDLWINHQFNKLDVRAVRKSIIGQRRDLNSSNSYSILPSLTKIGVIDSEGAALFHERPKAQPVFAFGSAGSGASSLAMALSMLGYRCCSDLDKLPIYELESLLAGSVNRTFNAYVNVGCLAQHISTLRTKYTHAKFIVTTNELACNEAYVRSLLGSLEGADVVVLHSDEKRKWRVVCEHLMCAPPVCSYPVIQDFGQQELLDQDPDIPTLSVWKNLKHDALPWVVESRPSWPGIRSRKTASHAGSDKDRAVFNDSLECIDTERWLLRDDTFPGNLALFRPENIAVRPGSGITLTVKEEALGVRDFSAAAISSCQKYLFGRFEVSMQATRVPGLVTGFFLHRDTPRQEIDIEIVGNRSDHLLVNVFYNPGGDGAKFDYGYRGTPSLIPLGFDAADALHTYAIEWDPSEIRWFVDGRLVYRRGIWNPTPIPHLPMTLHVNTWPTRSSELAGRLARRALPSAALVGSITVDTTIATACASTSG
ncbi:family 16 glycosylhydrolase [Pseudomonas chengduensis]|nr:family 16 glycosylhydrolase [Pseudomonas chengduensis]MDH1681815.1 family 16 glycosylhydrolase [Pseudomonas chengduensis]